MASIDRLSELGTTFAAAIDRHLKEFLPASRTERVWFINVNRALLQAWKTAARTFTVYVIPTMYDSEVETRGSDIDIYRYGLVFVETFSDQGEPSQAWVDQRIRNAASVVRKFGEIRDPLEGDTSGPRAEVGKFLSLCETDILQEEKLFWAEAEFEFRESVDA